MAWSTVKENVIHQGWKAGEGILVPLRKEIS